MIPTSRHSQWLLTKIILFFFCWLPSKDRFFHGQSDRSRSHQSSKDSLQQSRCCIIVHGYCSWINLEKTEVTSSHHVQLLMLVIIVNVKVICHFSRGCNGTRPEHVKETTLSCRYLGKFDATSIYLNLWHWLHILELLIHLDKILQVNQLEKIQTIPFNQSE